VISLRKGSERGHFEQGWLDTYHTFSFGQYHDRDQMGFRALRVINEDRVKPAQGFPEHSHQDMEIITYVLEGALEHKDSMGNTSVIRPGELQRMSAGTGVTHSEFNHSKKIDVHLLQIWILPEKKGIKPGYEQHSFRSNERRNILRLIASREGVGEAIKIHQDVRLYDCKLEVYQTMGYTVDKGRGVWIQVLSGNLDVDNHSLGAGDGAAISNQKDFTLRTATEAVFLLFDLG